MECIPVTKLPNGPEWIYEIKLDGYRAVGVRTSRESILYSRNAKNVSKRYPHIADSFRRFRKTWLRGQRCLEDINNFWMAHKPQTMSELYSHLHEELEMRLDEAERKGLRIQSSGS